MRVQIFDSSVAELAYHAEAASFPQVNRGSSAGTYRLKSLQKRVGLIDFGK